MRPPRRLGLRRMSAGVGALGVAVVRALRNTGRRGLPMPRSERRDLSGQVDGGVCWLDATRGSSAQIRTRTGPSAEPRRAHGAVRAKSSRIRFPGSRSAASLARQAPRIQSGGAARDGAWPLDRPEGCFARGAFPLHAETSWPRRRDTTRECGRCLRSDGCGVNCRKTGDPGRRCDDHWGNAQRLRGRTRGGRSRMDRGIDPRAGPLITSIGARRDRRPRRGPRHPPRECARRSRRVRRDDAPTSRPRPRRCPENECGRR